MISIRAPIGALCWFPNGQLCTALCRQIAFLSSLAPTPWQTSLVSLRWKSVGSISHVCHRNVRNREQAATGWPWSCACRNESNKNSMPATAFPALQNVHSHTHSVLSTSAGLYSGPAWSGMVTIVVGTQLQKGGLKRVRWEGGTF